MTVTISFENVDRNGTGHPTDPICSSVGRVHGQSAETETEADGGGAAVAFNGRLVRWAAGFFRRSCCWLGHQHAFHVPIDDSENFSQVFNSPRRTFSSLVS
jgi:hypothetical protein